MTFFFLFAFHLAGSLREVDVGGHSTNGLKEDHRNILGIPADRHVPVYMIIMLINVKK